MKNTAKTGKIIPFGEFPLRTLRKRLKLHKSDV